MELGGKTEMKSFLKVFPVCMLLNFDSQKIDEYPISMVITVETKFLLQQIDIVKKV